MTNQTTTTRTKILAPIAVIVGGLAILATMALMFPNIFSKSTTTNVTTQFSAKQLHQKFISARQDYISASSLVRPEKFQIWVQTAKQRRDSLTKLVRSNPAEFLKLALPSSELTVLPPEVAAVSEQIVQLKGKLVDEHADDFKHGKSHDRFYIHSTENGVKDTDIILVGNSAGLIPESTVNLSAIMLDGVTVVDAAQITITPSQSVATATGQKKVAVILFNFSSNPNNKPFTANDVYTAVFSSPTSVKAYYGKTSGGQLTLVGDSGGAQLNPPNPNGNIYVYGWYTINANPAFCDNQTWGNLAMAQAPSGALAGFDNFIFGFPNTASCAGWAGQALIGGNTSYNNGFLDSAYVYAHELGHNLGAHHANALYCLDNSNHRVPISHNCNSVEYGDPNDVMGWHGLNQFNNFHQGQFGWYQTGNNSQDVISSGPCNPTCTVTKTLYPIEADNFGTATRVLRIPLDSIFYPDINSYYYYLEYRQPSNPFDNFLPTDPVVNGITIRYGWDYNASEQSQLIDMTTNTPDYATNDQSLLPGNTFNDPSRGVSISVTIPSDKQTASVNVTFTCVHQQPTFNPVEGQGWGRAGQPLLYTINFTNNDWQECGSSIFTVTPSLPSGWTPSVVTPVTVGPRASTNITFSVTPPIGTPNGYYSLSEMVTNQSAPAATSTFQGSIRIDSMPPTVAILSPTNGMRLPRTGSIAVSTTASDNIYLLSHSMLIDNVAVQPTCSGNSSNQVCSFSWTVGTSLAAGIHTIKDTAIDLAGNVGSKTIKVCYPFRPDGSAFSCTGGGGGPKMILD